MQMTLIETDLHGTKSGIIIRRKHTKEQIINTIKIEGHQIELSDTWQQHETCRIMTYCDDNLTYRRIEAEKNKNDLQNISKEVRKTQKFILSSC